MRWSIAGILVLSVAGGGCTIADVVTPPGEDRLVIEAVLRTDSRRQHVLLHRSATAAGSPGEPQAEVVVTRDDGARAVFILAAQSACVSNIADDSGGPYGSCFVSPAELGYWVRPGRTYDLRVTTPRGELAQARTRVPGAFALVGLPFARERAEPAGSESVRQTTTVDPNQCRIPVQTPFPVTWTQARGAWGYIAPLNIFGLSGYGEQGGFQVRDPLELIGVSVSAADTTLLLPGEFGVFDRFDLDQDLLRFLQGGLPRNVAARLTVAAADRNYINGVRGGSFNPSGQVRISSIAGDGVGVFGSLVPLSTTVVVSDDPDTRPCGGA